MTEDRTIRFGVLKAGSIVCLIASGSCARGPVVGRSGTLVDRVLFQGSSRFGPVFVVEQGTRRSLRFGRPTGQEQSTIDLRDPTHEPLIHLRYALLALALVPSHGRLLMIGLGGGSYLRHARALSPRLLLEAVEINPLVVRLARRFFGIRTGPKLRVHVGDGREFVRRTKKRYRVVFVDAYEGESYPRRLGTQEFFREVRAILSADGVMVANIATRSAQAHQDLIRTITSIFPRARFFCPPGVGNTLVIAQSGPARLDATSIEAAARRLDRRSGARYHLAKAAARECRIRQEKGRILVDREPTPGSRHRGSASRP